MTTISSSTDSEIRPFKLLLMWMLVFVLTLTAGTAPAQDDSAIPEKLSQIVLPSVQFDNASLSEAVTFLRIKARQLDENESDPERKGFNVIVMVPKDNANRPLISLSLTNVPLIVAVKAVTELADCRYSIEPHAVVIRPSEDSRLFTRVFVVPPTFTTTLGEVYRGYDDPFADDADVNSDDNELPLRPTGIEMLTARGITFSDGTSAFFDPRNCQLVVRNTLSQLEMIESLIENESAKPAILNVAVEIYALPLARARALLVEHNPGANAAALVEALRADAAARIVEAPRITTRSGQRASIQCGKDLDFISGYEAVDGKDVAVHSKVFAGTKLLIDAVLGADGCTVDANVKLVQASGVAMMTRTKTVTPVSGKEVEINPVSIEQLSLTTATVLASGQTRLLGMINHTNTNGQSPEVEEARIAFLTVTRSEVHE